MKKISWVRLSLAREELLIVSQVALSLRVVRPPGQLLTISGKISLPLLGPSHNPNKDERG